MELPIDHFRLLGIGPAVDTQTVLRTLAQRLDRVPDQGFTTETLQVRARLLQDSADLLSDPSRRAAYERELTAVAEGESSVPALEITSSHEVAGLLLLLEAGQAQDAFELVCRSLQPPQAPALGSTREADLCLLAALACQKAAEDACSRRHFETAARLLQQGLQLLQRMGQVPEWRQRLLQDLDRLTPYLVLDLLSRELTVSDKRSEGLALLEQLVQRRGGLEGDGDPGFDGEEFQAFFKQILGFTDPAPASSAAQPPGKAAPKVGASAPAPVAQEEPFYKRLLWSSDPAPAAQQEPDARPIPLPPRREATVPTPGKPKPEASLAAPAAIASLQR